MASLHFPPFSILRNTVPCHDLKANHRSKLATHSSSRSISLPVHPYDPARTTWRVVPGERDLCLPPTPITLGRWKSDRPVDVPPCPSEESMSGLVVEGAQGLESLAVPNLIPTLESPLLPFPSFGVLLAYIARKKNSSMCRFCAAVVKASRVPLSLTVFPVPPQNADECNICDRDCCGPDCCTEDIPSP